MRTLVVAVGRLRPPYADDVQHYQKLLARPHAARAVEVREDEQVQGRIPDRAYVCLLAPAGASSTRLAFAASSRSAASRASDLCFVVGGPRGLDMRRLRHARCRSAR